MNYKSQIEGINTEWNKALNSGKVKALVLLYTENAILSPGNGKSLVNRAEIEKLFNGFVEGGVHDHTLEIIECGGSEKMMYQMTRWSAQGAETNGETPTFGGITTSIHEKSTDGSWLTRAHIWNVTN
jgi:ketosteroid isomerase-like protein